MTLLSHLPSRVLALFYRLLLPALACLSVFVCSAAEYPLTPDSQPQPGVPKGSVRKFSFAQSKIFPGTQRDYWIYIPAQYDPATPACLYVNQDGIQYNAPVVFDSLIAKKEMPITIGVFVTPGVVKPLTTNVLPRFNRSYEYDSITPDYARFLIDDLLPEVERQTTADGKPIRISKDPNDHAIGGSSSGAICAFTAAWERPDAFRRVFSCIGTYVGLRGGHVYPTLIRKTEPKPIRIFLQDGANDLNIYGGDWWMANQTMERALVFAGYEVEHRWGEGAHETKQAAAVFPDAMRWLWKDWPQPVKKGESQNACLRDLLLPGQDWELVGEGYQFTEGMAANRSGELFFNDIPRSKTWKVSADGHVSEFIADSHFANGQAFGPDGRLYAVAGGTEQIVAYDKAGASSILAHGIKGNDLVVSHNGWIYVTAPNDDGSASKLWLVREGHETSVVDTGLKFANGVTLSPDQSLLYVADYRSHWVYSYTVQADGSLTNKQKYFHLHAPDTADDAGADGMRCDRDGRLYVATRMGIQVCDQAGRVNAILPTPNGRVANLTFGGPEFDTLYAACGDRIYKRKLKVRGALPFEAPIKPAPPRL